MVRFMGWVLAFVVAFAGAGVATASDYCPVYKKVVCYETVVCTEIQKVPYVKEVVKYDTCGKPYKVYIECVKEVEVKVAKKVPVVKYVKVYD